MVKKFFFHGNDLKLDNKATEDIVKETCKLMCKATEDIVKETCKLMCRHEIY